MSLRKIGFFIIVFITVFSACNEDDGLGITPPEIRDRAVQQQADMDSINEYLKSHYYNKSEFSVGLTPRIADLEITKITDEVISEDADSLLINAVGAPKSTTFFDTDYEYYILKLRQGGGENSPSFVDDIRVLYEGFLLDGEIFDTNLEVPIAFDLATDIGLSGGVSGWLNVFPNFNVAEGFNTNADGTIEYNNPGMGVMFLPSGLAYFSSGQGVIAPYESLIFKFELLQYSVNDHDNDGVPSFLELGLNNENANVDTLEKLILVDTDENGNPNFLDTDDDGDGILTINEDINKDGDPTNDIGANGIPNYLDPEETASKNDN
jgi:hypothetical protein